AAATAAGSSSRPSCTRIRASLPDRSRSDSGSGSGSTRACTSASAERRQRTSEDPTRPVAPVTSTRAFASEAGVTRSLRATDRAALRGDEPNARVYGLRWDVLDVQGERLQQQLDPDDDREDGDHHRSGRRDRTSLRGDGPVPYAPHRAEEPKEDARDEIERHRGEVAHEIFEAHPTNETPQEPPRELQRRTRFREMAGRARRIARRDIDVTHDRAKQAEIEEQARLEEVPLPDAPRGEQRNERGVDRGVAVRRIEDVPVPGRELREERQSGVADASPAGHRAKLTLVEEAIAFGVVGRAGHDRRDEREQMFGIHLSIGIHLRDDLGAEGYSTLVAAHHGCADALVLFMLDEGHARVLQITHDIAGAVWAAVVHDDDLPDERREAGDHVGD